jgi:hypothetical protein
MCLGERQAPGWNAGEDHPPTTSPVCAPWGSVWGYLRRAPLHLLPRVCPSGAGLRRGCAGHPTARRGCAGALSLARQPIASVNARACDSGAAIRHSSLQPAQVFRPPGKCPRNTASSGAAATSRGRLDGVSVSRQVIDFAAGTLAARQPGGSGGSRQGRSGNSWETQGKRSQCRCGDALPLGASRAHV